MCVCGCVIVCAHAWVCRGGIGGARLEGRGGAGVCVVAGVCLLVGELDVLGTSMYAER